MARINIKWTKHLKDESSIQKFEDSVSSALKSNQVFDRLREILDEYKKDLYKNMASQEEIDSNPNWALKQAFNSGMLSQINRIEDLIKKDTK